jgi:hypothetical protein
VSERKTEKERMKEKQIPKELGVGLTVTNELLSSQSLE